jgi:hypothetical protein
MNRRLRPIVAAAAVVVFLASACGSDGPSPLSAEEFADKVAEICDGLQADLDALGEPADTAEMATLARKAGNLLADARTSFGEITPPDELARDYADLLAVVDDQIEQATELKNAARADDEAAMNAAGEALSKLVDEKDAIADDLGVPECRSTDESTDTTVAETVPADTSAPATIPVVTLPVTLVPPTQPGTDTTPAPTDAPFEILDIAAAYSPPAGYRFVSDVPGDAAIELLASDPDLAQAMAFVGVAELEDEATGEQVAALWLGGTTADDVGMPASWKTIDCPEGDLVSSPGGVLGVTCAGSPDSGVVSIFTATDGAFGISLYTFVAGIDPVALVDAFLAANG